MDIITTLIQLFPALLSHPILTLAVAVCGLSYIIWKNSDFDKMLSAHAEKDDALAARVDGLASKVDVMDAKLDVVIDLMRK